MPHVEISTRRRSALLAFLASCVLLAVAGSTGALAAAQADETPNIADAYTTVAANADGSYTATVHTAPVNFRDATGAWQPIDPTLVAEAGGFRNSAGPVSVSFASSAKPAAGQLVEIASGDRKLGFSLEAPSPLAKAPVVVGNTISYPDVYPGVSLAYTLEPQVLKEELVLTERPRADLRIRVPLSLTGLSAAKQPNGEIWLRDGKGETVFSIPPLVMVDSAGPAGSKTGASSAAVSTTLATVSGRQLLTIEPDAAWLADAKRVYPVSIDPMVTLSPSTGTFIRSDLSTPQSGATTYQVGSYNGGQTIARTLVTFNLGSLQGVSVSAASLSAWHSWAPTCTPKQVDTHRITSSWSGSVIWATQPTIDATPLASALTSRGYSASCPAARVVLGDVTSAVQNWLSGSWQNDGLEVRAASETDSFSYKQFRSDFQLEVTYNVTMSPPTNLQPADGTLSTSTTPTLSATFPGPSYGYVEFEMRRSEGGAIVASGNGNNVLQGQTSSWTVPAGLLASGYRYSWRARSRTSSDASAWTAPISYIADQAPTTSLHSPVSGTETATVASLSPVLRLNASDPEQNPFYAQFQVSTTNTFTTIVSDSGWLPNTKTYTVAEGALQNDIRSETGVTYYWRARAKDTLGADSGWDWSTFAVKLSLTGLGGNAPTFSRGPIAVNEATGNVMTQAPGPSFPTIVGGMGIAPTYNSFDEADMGLGPGWTLGILDLRNASTRLVDRSQLSGTLKLDAVELVTPDGARRLFNHVGDSAIYLPPKGETGAIVTKNADTTWTLTDADGSIVSYGVGTGGVSKLSSIQQAGTDEGLGTMTYAFVAGSSEKVQSITDPAGRTLTLTWNSANPSGCPSPALLCVTGPDGVSWKYWGQGGKLSGVHNGTRELVAYTYWETGRLAAVENANDLNASAASPGYDDTHKVGVAYDSQGRAAMVADGPIHSQPSGQQTSIWSFTYLGAASLTATRAAHAGMPAGTVRQASGRTEVTPPKQYGLQDPKKTVVYYDGQGQPMQVTDITGAVTMASYDTRGRLLWTEDADGNPTDNTWDDALDVLLETEGPDPDGAGSLGRPMVENRYDEKVAGTALTPGTTLQGLQAAYYANPNLAGRPAARQTDGTVDFSWGTGGPSALGTQTDSFSVRWSGHVKVDTAGEYTFTTVSDEGVRLTVDGISLIDKWQTQTATSHSSLPLSLSAGLHRISLDYYENTGPAEVELRWSCGGCSPAVADQVIPAQNLRPSYANQTSTVSPAGKVAFSHVLNPAKGLSDYSLVKDGLTNVITSFSYDAYGRVTQKVMPKGNASRTIASDGTLEGSPNTAYATTFTYYGLTDTASPPSACGGGSAVNQAGSLSSKTPYGIAPTTYVYNLRGETVATTKGAGTTCATYSAEGRLTSTKAPGEAQSTTYAYDPAGLLRTATDASGTLTTEYDEAGRVMRSVDSFGAEATVSYDMHGNPTQRSAKATSGGTAYQTSYAYDDADRLTSLTDPASRQWSFFYDSRSLLKATQYPNGTFSWSDVNQAGWQTALYNRHGTLSAPLPSSVPSDASPIADYAYTYELEGRKTQEVRTGGGLTTETTSYVYDDLGRLSQVTLPDSTVRVYGFDLDSNRTQITENGQTVATYAYDASKLDMLSSVTQGGQQQTFGYDGDGNTTARGQDTLSWDGRGRHAGGSFSGTSLSYGFDAGGFRRLRTSAGQTSHYRLGGLYETTSGGTITNTDTAGPSGDLAHYAGPPTTGSNVSFLYYSGHGDLAAEADLSGTRTAAYTYDPFGALRSGSAPVNATSERWTGGWDKKLDSSSSLIEMGARPYDPALGRFLSLDPVEGGALNGCDFAGQDPINMGDPSGMSMIPIDSGTPLCPLFVMVTVGTDLVGNLNIYVSYDDRYGVIVGAHGRITLYGSRTVTYDFNTFWAKTAPKSTYTVMVDLFGDWGSWRSVSNTRRAKDIKPGTPDLQRSWKGRAKVVLRADDESQCTYEGGIRG